MDARKELMQIVAELKDVDDMEQLWTELLTPKEVEALSLRWQLLKELHEGEPQRAIAARHKISLCKITRGSKILKKKNSVTLKLLDKYYSKKEKRDG
ncbi:Trp family transcriptional regulator [Desulfomarina sp.]